MKSVLILILLFYSLTTFSQNQDIYIAPKIIETVKDLQKKGIDTIFVYNAYGYLVVDKTGENCNDIIDARIVYNYKNKVYTKRIYCNNRQSKAIIKDSEAFKFFKANLETLTIRTVLPNGQRYPSLPLDSGGDAFYMRIGEKWFYIFLDEEQKSNGIWHKYDWVNLGIRLSELNKTEMH